MYYYRLDYVVMPAYVSETREMGVKAYKCVMASSESIARYVVEQMYPGYRYVMVYYSPYER
jgi:hypothetical protein